MRAKFLRLLVLSSFILVGCNNPFKKGEPQVEPEQQQSGDQGGGEQGGGEQGGGEQTPTDTHLQKKVNVKMEALLKNSSTPYNVEFDYDDNLFLKDAEVYDKDLSMLSLGAAISATYEDWAKDFLRDCEFNDALSHQMDIEPTEDSLGYTLGHKSIDNSELFAVMVRGHEYKREWANNFIIGETGDHEGWLARVTELNTSLSTYINQYKDEKTVRLWMVGYSRAGAISNMLASLILRTDGINVNPKNMFVYTFEAPAGLTEEHAHQYANVHNIVNSADIVTYIPPTQYGLHRAGVDFEIYDINFGTYVTQFDSSITVPDWVPCNSSDFGGNTISNDVDLTQYLINDLFSQKVSSTATAHNRESYVANYQSGLSYTIGILFALSPNSRSQILANTTSLAMTIYFDSDGSQLANTLKPYLNVDGVSYTDSELVAACAVFEKAFINLFGTIIGIYMSSTYSSNLTRILDMHYPEVTYCLLKNANSKLA